jgi:ribulose-phosphate 3-epimerase
VPWDEWIRTVEVEPSLYAADFANLGGQVEALLRTGARIFHYDIGDGHFVEPITMGPIVLASISERIHRLGGVVDCHLMTEAPERHFAALAEAGADSVTVHHEAVADLAGVVRAAREQELQVGLALKPSSSVDEGARAAIAANVDVALCMSVEPGYSGQAFLPGSLERIRRLRELLPPHVHVQVDGGIGPDNVAAAYGAGATLLVAASAIFGREDLPRAYRRLIEALA